ncbi:hypothetical protein ACLKA7_012352 [Drosophila subpalustris]
MLPNTASISMGKLESCRQMTWGPTLTNLVTLYSSSKDLAEGGPRAGPSMSHYSGRIVDDILEEIFAERRGHFPETSSSCKLEEQPMPSPERHVDRRLKYWREMLAKRKKLQRRVESQTGKTPEQILFNRRSTFDNRNKESVLRLLDYADRMSPEKLSTRPINTLREVVDPLTCEILEGVDETWPKAEQDGYKDVEIIGLPKVVQEELLGKKAAPERLPHGWIKSRVLEERIEERFDSICDVLEFFPDLDNLQVTGTNIEKLKQQPYSALLEEEPLDEISTSNPSFDSEEQITESLDEPNPLESESQSELNLPEIGLKINGKDFIPCDQPLNDCLEILTKFKCDPFQRRVKHILQLTNIGKQTLSFNWQQGIYYYNKATLLLAKDNEFLFDTNSFRLTQGQTYNLVVMYQPRKVSMAKELWRLHIDPKIICANQESLQLRFHGCCTAPKEYMARLQELHCTVICKSNTIEMQSLMHQQASLVPLIERPLACCAYERTLDERELFNSLNPGYNCIRFDDLEVFKGMHKHLKKPREPQWDLRLDTIKMLIMRIESLDTRKKMFANFMVVLEPLLGAAPDLEVTGQLEVQKQRTRFVYVRGVICNGIEEWEDLMFTIEESFYKSELQQYFMNQMVEGEEEEEEDSTAKIAVLTGLSNNTEEAELNWGEKVTAEVLKSLHHSKFFRDALYMQTYSHLCNIAENIVSVIESTEDVPN